MEDNKPETVNKSKPADDIDMIELLSRIGAGIKAFFTNIFKYVFNALCFIVKFFYKNIIAIASFTVAGFVAGMILYFINEKEYSSEMIVSSNSLSNDEMINYINNLSVMCQEKNYVSLGNNLGLDSAAASRIKKIRALWAYDLNSDGLVDYIDYSGDYNLEYKDTVHKRIWDKFYIRAVVTDEKIFSKLNAGVFGYVASNTYILENNELRKKHQEEMIRDIDLEIKKLDSLQKFEYFDKNRIMPQVGANQVVLFTEKERKLYHDDIFALIDKKQNLESMLTVRKDPIIIIQGFISLAKVEDSIFEYLSNYGIKGFLLGILLVFVWLYGAKIHKVLVKE